MLNITAYGAAQEVGRSCILIEDKDRKILLDCGLKLNHDSPTSAPEGIEEHIEDLNGVIISHAHLDHSGYTPGLFALDYQGTVFMTPPTKELASVLWYDHLKIEGDRHFNSEHITITQKNIVGQNYGTKFKIADGITAQLYDAGHVLGSAGVLLDWDGTTIFYTGDQMSSPTMWHDAARLPEDEVDIVITEATNALRPVPSRKQTISDLSKTILRAVARKSKILIPSFALGRSQELQVAIADNFEELVPTYVDGMILKMNKIYKKYFDIKWVSHSVLQWTAERTLDSPFDHPMITPIHKRNGNSKETMRRELMKQTKSCIIITTSGMLEGGPIHSYLKYAGSDPNTLITLVGYQVEHTIGRSVYDGARNLILSSPDGVKTAVQLNAQVEKFNFSAHAPINGLHAHLKQLNPQHVMIVHCQTEAGTALKSAINSEFETNLLNRTETVTVK